MGKCDIGGCENSSDIEVLDGDEMIQVCKYHFVELGFENPDSPRFPEVAKGDRSKMFHVPLDIKPLSSEQQANLHNHVERELTKSIASALGVSVDQLGERDGSSSTKIQMQVEQNESNLNRYLNRFAYLRCV